MKRRPVVIAAAAVAVIILFLRVLGVPLRPGYREDAFVKQLLTKSGEVTVRGRVSSWDVRDSCSLLVIKNVRLLNGEEEWRMGGIRLTLFPERGEPSRFRIGTGLILRGELRELEGAENPGQFDSAAYYKNQGIVYRMTSPEILSVRPAGTGIREMLAALRYSLRVRIRSVFSGETAGILIAMLLGEKDLLLDESRELWRTGGILHMLSISGMHLTLLGMGLFLLLRRIYVPLTAAAAVAITFMAVYTVFTGMGLPTVRALVMSTLMITAKLTGRTFDTPTALALAALLILAENPEYLFYSGFLLSFAALVIVCLFGHRGKLVTTVMLFLGMLPILLSTSFELSLYSPVANLLLVPFLPAILLTGAIGAAIGPVIGTLGLQTAGGMSLAAVPAEGLLAGMNAVLRRIAALPAATLVLGDPGPVRILIYYAALAGWALLMKKNRLWKRRFLFYLFVPVLVLILSLRIRTGLSMTFLSVGQGDGIVLQMPNGLNLLVDGGSSTVKEVGKYRIVPYLKSQGISKLDYVFVTHLDGDHMNGILEILEDMRTGAGSVRIGTVVLPYLPENAPDLEAFKETAAGAGCRILCAAKGDRFAFGEVEVEVLGPDASAVTSGGDSNSQCLVLAVRFGAFDALLMGDAEGEGEESVIRELMRTGYLCDVLKVAHHGSKYSTPEAFLEQVSPAVSIVSAGAENRYGHPHEELLERLRKAGTAVFRTDLRGAVTVRTDGRTYSVNCCLDP